MPTPALSADDTAQRAAFVRYLRTGRRTAPLELKVNPNHDSATGQFTTAEGGAGVQEAQLSPGLVARGVAMSLGLPADGIAFAVQNIVGAPLTSDMRPMSVLIAENNNQKRSKIRGLQARINEHRSKLLKDPDNDSANHWRTEIRAWTAQIEHIRKRLPGGR